MRRLFVTGIDTDVGKTVVSAVLTQKLQADYWKPVQAGDLHDTDSMKVGQWVANPSTNIHPEAYGLTHPMSPHAAAKRDGQEIKLTDIHIPQTSNDLVIEGAGGLMVPLNHRELVIDMIPHLHAQAVLVSRHYLGSINHTILSVQALQWREIPIIGIIFNGDENKDSESIIETTCNVNILGRIPELDTIDQQNIINSIDTINI